MKKLLLPLLLFVPILAYSQDLTDDSEWVSVTYGTELTIATGAVTATADIVAFTLDTEGDASTDDLDTITQSTTNQTLIELTLANSARNVVLKDGTGNLTLGRDITLDTANTDRVVLRYVGSAWRVAFVSESLLQAATGDSATGFFSAGTIEHEYGGLEQDVSAYDGFVGISGGTTYEGNLETELEGAIGGDNIIIETEIDTQSEVAGLRTDLVASAVTAAVGSQGDGAQTAESIFITGGAADTVITIPSLYVGAKFFIENETSTSKKVYPASGDNIGGGLNTEIDVPAGQILTIKAKDATNANSYLSSDFPPKIYVEKHASSHTLSDSVSTGECYGSVHYVTAASVTLTLPAAVDGMSLTVIANTANVVIVDSNASDLIILDGTSLDDGDSIDSGGTAGEVVVLTYYDSTGWFAVSDGWVDGGAS